MADELDIEVRLVDGGRDEVVERVRLMAGANTVGVRISNAIKVPALDEPGVLAEITLEDEAVTLTARSRRYDIIVNGTALPRDAQRPLDIGDVIAIKIDHAIEIYRLVLLDRKAPAQERPPEPVSPSVPPEPPPPRPLEARDESRFHPVASDVSRYLADLPLIYQGQRDPFLGRYLKIFEEIWESFEQRQDHIALYFDPRTCPVSFLPMLESWFGLTFSANWPEARRRKLILHAARLFAERGARSALQDAIAYYTGVQPHISDPQEFVITIDPRLPAGSEQLEKSVIEAIIHAFKPAHLAYRLVWR